jgi:hypothetical protein
VHGANFCFIVSRRADGQVEVRCGKRREVLRDGEDFFGHAVLLDRLRPQVLRLFAHLEQHQTTLLADHVSGLRTFISLLFILIIILFRILIFI